ncbi:MAG: hypothetical protein NC093_10470 [Alistipes sp.]|nr:hypothetical protein [Alistipes sp.]
MRIKKYPRIRLGFTFLLFNALLFLFKSSGIILGFYAACVIHELGHIAAIQLTGGCVREIALSLLGIKISADPAATKAKGLFVLLSGPAANLISGWICLKLGIFGFFARFSIAEGLFNLLPLSCLDGGAAIELLTQGIRHEKSLKTAAKLLFLPPILLYVIYS